MVDVTVEPETFAMVRYEPDRIRDLAARVADDVGLDVGAVTIRLDETTPLARAVVVSEDPFVVDVQGGAFEETRRPRNLSEDRTLDTLGRLFLRTRDRRTPGFGQPPDDAELDLRQWTAWEIYTVGRLVRLGYRGQRARRLYQFRSRHGFTDAADAAFERLWSAPDGLTWADIDAVSLAGAGISPRASEAERGGGRRSRSRRAPASRGG